MKRNCMFVLFAGAIALALNGGPVSAAGEDNEVLISRGQVTVTKADFFQLLNFAVAKEKRATVLADEHKVREMVADLFVMRMLAAEARTQGLADDPAIRFRIGVQQDQVLMQAALDKVVAGSSEPNFEKLARERYVANPEQFAQPERVRASHILIAVNPERNREQALERAKEIRHRAIDGATPFADLAAELSDDPSASRNGGDLGYFERGKMVKSFEDAVFAMNKAGQIGEVVESQFGFHVIQYQDRKPARTLSFDEVKADLISQEQQKFRATLRTEKLEQMRSLDGIEVNQPAVSAIVAK